GVSLGTRFATLHPGRAATGGARHGTGANPGVRITRPRRAPPVAAAGGAVACGRAQRPAVVRRPLSRRPAGPAPPVRRPLQWPLRGVGTVSVAPATAAL